MPIERVSGVRGVFRGFCGKVLKCSGAFPGSETRVQVVWAKKVAQRQETQDGASSILGAELGEKTREGRGGPPRETLWLQKAKYL